LRLDLSGEADGVKKGKRTMQNSNHPAVRKTERELKRRSNLTAHTTKLKRGAGEGRAADAKNTMRKERAQGIRKGF